MVKPKVVAIIPARGGSKSIPRKNIRNFAGFPLIAWSIAAAKESKHVDRVIVSTDDEEIASIAAKFGAEVPFIRPSKLAEDETPDLPVFIHALEWLTKNENYKPEVVVQLRPTSPIRSLEMVDQSVEILLKNPNADSVRGVVLAEQSPHKMWRITNEESPMENLLNEDGIDEPHNAPRQILPVIYWQTGHIDAIRPEIILGGSMSGKKVFPLIIDSKLKVDIDNPQDWSWAEWLINNIDLPIVSPDLPQQSK